MTAKAQLVTELGGSHNQFYIGSGYSDSFFNTTYGINHTRYFKRLKRDISGILDFSSPLCFKYYTRYIFRKGFQFDIYKKNNFKLPIAIISSSVKKRLPLFNFHDIITNISFLPGIYKGRYTFAGDISLNFLWFYRIHYNDEWYKQGGTKPNINSEKINVSVGVILAYNLKRFSFIFKGGFQQRSNWEFIKKPFYAVGIFAYKLNFRKRVQL